MAWIVLYVGDYVRDALIVNSIDELAMPLGGRGLGRDIET